jgi:hypothetical protein
VVVEDLPVEIAAIITDDIERPSISTRKPSRLVHDHFQENIDVTFAGQCGSNSDEVLDL